jgi:hypothetical protein
MFHRPTTLGDDSMGTTLHNKIYLGRHSLLASRRVRTALVLGALAGAGLMWAVVRTLK